MFFCQTYRGSKTFTIVYPKTNLFFFKYPNNVPPLPKLSLWCVFRVKNNCIEFFGFEIGKFQFKQSFYVRSFQRYRSRTGGIGTPCILVNCLLQATPPNLVGCVTSFPVLDSESDVNDGPLFRVTKIFTKK